MKEKLEIEKIETEIKNLIKKLADIEIQVKNLGNGSHGLARQFYDNEREMSMHSIQQRKELIDYLKKK